MISWPLSYYYDIEYGNIYDNHTTISNNKNYGNVTIMYNVTIGDGAVVGHPCVTCEARSSSEALEPK